MKQSDKLILGTVQIGLDYGINNRQGKVRLEDSLSILNEAYTAGIRTLDSAEVYGNAHNIIGKHHEQNPNQVFNVITKIPANADADTIGGKVQKYLDELGVNQLNTLMFHSFDSYKSNPEMKGLLLDLKSDGLFSYLGVSVYTNQEIEAIITDDEIDLIQLPFNLLDNYSHRGELLEKAKRKGKIIHTRSVFLQGLFFMNPEEEHPIVAQLKKELTAIRQLSKSNQISVVDLALGYCFAQNHLDQVLIGVDSISQLKENLKALKNPIPNELIKQIDKLLVEDKNLLNPSLWN